MSEQDPQPKGTGDPKTYASVSMMLVTESEQDPQPKGTGDFFRFDVAREPRLGPNRTHSRKALVTVRTSCSTAACTYPSEQDPQPKGTGDTPASFMALTAAPRCPNRTHSRKALVTVLRFRKPNLVQFVRTGPTAERHW